MTWTLTGYVWRRIIKHPKSSLFWVRNSWAGMNGRLAYTRCLCQLLLISVSCTGFCDHFPCWSSFARFLDHCICFLTQTIFLSWLKGSIFHHLIVFLTAFVPWMWLHTDLQKHRQIRKTVNAEERNTTAAREVQIKQE